MCILTYDSEYCYLSSWKKCTCKVGQLNLNVRITWFSFFIIIQWCSWFQTINGLYKLLSYFHTNMYVSALCGSVLTHFFSIHFCCFINKAYQSVKNRWNRSEAKVPRILFFICSLCLLWQIKRKIYILFQFIIMGKSDMV